MINCDNIAKIKAIHDYLEKYEYGVHFQQINGYYNYYFNPWQKYDVVMSNLQSYDEKNQLLFKLLLLGCKLKCRDLEMYLDHEFLQCLLDVNFLTQEGEFHVSKYSIISYFEYYFVVSTLPDYPTVFGQKQDVYIGMDSYRLASILPKKKINSHLDLCTGSGIQAIVESPFSLHSYAVEINPETAPVTRFNTILNDVSDHVKVVESDVFEKVADSKYDLITANPPFIPIPKDLPFPIAGDGGEDGLYIIDKILEGLEAHLNENGHVIIIGEAIGDENGPILFDHLKKYLPKGYACKLILQMRTSKEQYIESIISLYQNLFDRSTKEEVFVQKWNDLFQKFNSNSYYMFILKIERKGLNESSFELIKNYNHWNDEPKPTLTKDVVVNIETPNSAILVHKGRSIGTVPIAIAECLRRFDGKKTVNDVVLSYDKGKGRYKDIRQSLEQVCITLERINAIEL